jgi:hypothetical protein
MKKNQNESTSRILVIASVLGILLALLDIQTESFTHVFVGDSGANSLALIMYTSVFALIISFFRIISASFFQVPEEIK